MFFAKVVARVAGLSAESMAVSYGNYSPPRPAENFDSRISLPYRNIQYGASERAAEKRTGNASGIRCSYQEADRAHVGQEALGRAFEG
jgi:hypothetical protein